MFSAYNVLLNKLKGSDSMANVYLLLTGTSSVLSSMIGVVTHEQYNHISISLDKELTEVYSFGRINPSNPFNGGFVKEDTTSDFYSRALCQVYELEVDEKEYESLKRMIQVFKNQETLYSYNLLGLVTAALKIEWNRPYIFFCSEFVSHLLIESNILTINQPPSTTTPQEILKGLDVTLIYEGTIYEYKHIIKGKSLPRRIIHSVYDLIHRYV